MRRIRDRTGIVAPPAGMLPWLVAASAPSRRSVRRPQTGAGPCPIALHAACSTSERIPQHLHELMKRVDETARRRKGRLLLPDAARLFGLQVSKERLLVAVPEVHGVEGRDLLPR